MALSFGRKKTQKASEYEVVLNLRGRARQFGKRTFTGLKSSGKQSFMIILVTLVLFLLFTVINTSFASTDNLLAMVKSLVPYAMLGLGVTFVIATGGIDLSIGTVCIAVAVMAGTICRTTTSVTDLLWLTIPLMLIFGLAFGLLNGFLVAKLKLPPFIATLGTMMLSRGISSVLANIVNKMSSAIKYPSTGWFQKVFTNLNGFPIGVVWLIVLTLVCMYVMYKSKVGRYILAIGSNEEATRLSGINVDFYKIVAYAIAGLFAGFAALFYVAANPSLALASGNGMELDAIAGVYIGGTSTTGGIASIVGTIFGALILVVIRQGLNFTLALFDSGISSTFITYAVTGIIVVFAVLMDLMKNKSANKVKLNDSAAKCKARFHTVVEEIRIKQDYLLSDKRLSKEEKKKHCEDLDKQIAELKAVFVEEYIKCKREDAEASRKFKESQKQAKAAAKQSKIEAKAAFKESKRQEKEAAKARRMQEKEAAKAEKQNRE